jgi:hypothetical protein
MKNILQFVILAMALVMAFTVAYVSVSGLMTIFTGVGLVGLIFFISLEISKVVLTSAIHTYKEKLNWIYKSLMTTAIIIAIAITSIGVYGFLSNAYKSSFANMTATSDKVGLLEVKKEILKEDKTSLDEQVRLKRDRVKSIINVRSQQETRLDSLYAKGWYSSAKRTEKIIQQANDDVNKIESEINGLNSRMSEANDSINSYNLQIIELNSNNDGAIELGSLIYLSDVTGMHMDEVMKWFIFLLIIIGDPVAVLLVIAFNRIANKEEEEEEKELPLKIKKSSTTLDVPNDINDEPIETNEKVEITNPQNEGTKRIRREDIKEIKDKNRVDRIGSNKEIRDGKSDKVFFKRR